MASIMELSHCPPCALALPKWLAYAIEAFSVVRLVPQLTVGVAFGFGAQSDQERILISELNRFVRFEWDVVIDLAARQ